MLYDGWVFSAWTGRPAGKLSSAPNSGETGLLWRPAERCRCIMTECRDRATMKRMLVPDVSMDCVTEGVVARR